MTQAVVSGFVRNNYQIVKRGDQESLEVKSMLNDMIRFLFVYFKHNYEHLTIKPFVQKGLLHTHYALNMKGDIQQVFTSLAINHADHWRHFPYKAKYKRAFLTGVFIATGTISAPESKVYHLQMQFEKHCELQLTQKLLKNYQFHFHIRTMNSKYLLYLKKADDISNFLKVLDASNAVLQFENKRIQRDFRNSINRFNNIDISNQKKILLLSDKQIQQIKSIQKDQKWHLLSDKCRMVCQMRLDNPDASYQEIIDLIENKYGWSISKAGLTYLFKQMSTVYELK